MANLLVIRANHVAWSSAEREQLVDAAVKSFTMRRHCMVKVARTDTECRNRTVMLVHNVEVGLHVNQPPIKMSKLDDAFDTMHGDSESEYDHTNDSDDSNSNTNEGELEATPTLSSDESCDCEEVGEL